MGRLLRGEGQDVQVLRHQRGPVVRRRDLQQAVSALEPHQALPLADLVPAGASNRNQAAAKAEAEVHAPATKHDDDGAGTLRGREGLPSPASTILKNRRVSVSIRRISTAANPTSRPCRADLSFD